MAESSSSAAAAVAAASGYKRPPPSSSSDSADPPPIPPVPPGWTRCHAYVERKHRYCRQQCQGKQSNDGGRPRYCGNHRHLFVCTTTTIIANSTTQTQPDDNSIKDKEAVSNFNNKMKQQRIPCPMDPTHHIQADKLEKHMLICPKIKQQRAMEKLYYYHDSLNAGGHGCIGLQQSSSSERKGRGIEWAKRVALCVLKVHEQVFSKSHHCSPNNPDRNSDLNRPYCMTQEEIVNALPLQDLSSFSASLQQQRYQQHDEKSNLARAIQAYKIKSGGPKHVHQQASLLGHLRQLGAIPSTVSSSTMTSQPSQQQLQETQRQEQRKRKRRINILEMGAGRGMMGLVAAGVAAAAATRTTATVEDHDDSTPSTTATTIRLILVERSGCRSKADRILRNHKNHSGPFNTVVAKKHATTTAHIIASTNDTNDLTSTQETCASTPPPPPTPPVKDYMNLQDLAWARVQCDLAHVDMKEVLKHSASSGGADGDKNPSFTIQPQQHQQVKEEVGLELEEEEIHVVAKHLCGVGTDLALKSLQPIRHSISTCLLATCCHGVCSWKDYVGRDYLQSVMTGKNNDNNSNITNDMKYLSQFGEAEFELLCQWSAGTVATNWTDSNNSSSGGGGKKKSPQPDEKRREQLQKHRNDSDDGNDDGNEHNTNNYNYNDADPAAVMGVATIVEALELKCGVQGLGRACQRLIDYGRLEYMRHVLFGNDASSATTTASAATAATACPSNEHSQQDNVQLVYYVPPEVTPQNAALIGRRR
jgi:tRNA:m4X modification enzyme